MLKTWFISILLRGFLQSMLKNSDLIWLGTGQGNLSVFCWISEIKMVLDLSKNGYFWKMM